MPSWNIHLAIAKQVNKKLKLDKDAFYLGNLLPDVDYGMKKTRHETHYYGIKCPNCPKEYLPNYKEFIKDNNKKLNNPLILGELVHILTDYYYNKIIYQNYWLQDKDNNIIGINLLKGKPLYIKPGDTNILKEYKHRDLELYGKYLFNKKMVTMPSNKILSKYIKDTIYSIEDINNRCNYLNTTYKKKNNYTILEKVFGLNYKMISKSDLDIMFNDCIKFIEEEIKEYV